MKAWRFIENNETRVKQFFFLKKVNIYPIRVKLIFSCDFRSAFESSSKNFYTLRKN